MTDIEIVEGIRIDNPIAYRDFMKKISKDN